MLETTLLRWLAARALNHHTCPRLLFQPGCCDLSPRSALTRHTMGTQLMPGETQSLCTSCGTTSTYFIVWGLGFPLGLIPCSLGDWGQTEPSSNPSSPSAGQW